MIPKNERCAQQVYSESSYRSHPCQRRAVRDGYCQQHHPDSVAAREAERKRRYEQKAASSPYRTIERLAARIAELEAERATIKNGVNK